MRYENPLNMVEDAGAADLIAGGRLQLGISRGSPEQVIAGFRYFGYVPPEQIRLFREAWTKAGHEREPRVSVSRSIFALVAYRVLYYRGTPDITAAVVADSFRTASLAPGA
jgi:alkanesulfonate monooxygenase SsuD/methylene tetrahydromethanopterin reductase-like flavin-dependent oxidoreductase (luciferase family)